MNEVTTRSTPSVPPVAAGEIRLALEQMDGFAFRVRFDEEAWPELLTDEPHPLGRSRGPNPSRLLAASIGNCLAASLLFCLQKGGIDVVGLEADVHVDLIRNERKRLRIGKVRVHLRPHIDQDDTKLAACLEAFQDFCVVTESVREGIDVDVDVQIVADDAYGCEG